MSQSLVQIYTHFVFSTKERKPFHKHEDIRADMQTNQEEHHRTITFEDEYRRLLTKYGVPWDERYVWD